MTLLICGLCLLPQTAIAAMGCGGCGGGGMGGGGSGSVIDPPAGAAFKDPPVMPNLSTVPGIVEVNLEANISPVSVNGTMANLMTYNGSYPGPTIYVKRGDIVKVHFKNSLPYTTAQNILGFANNISNIHTHGWHVSPMEPADAAHLSIYPGFGYDYEYDMSLHEPGTLDFYHPHSHGRVAEQYFSGLAGALVTADETDVLKNFETHIMVLKDITITSGGVPEPYTSMMQFMNGKEGNLIMINGQVNPVLSIRPGQVQRWRLVNASNARFYKLSLQGHTLQAIGTDGGLLDKPYAQTYILLSPGERVDLLVKGSSTKGTYKFLSLPYSRMGGMTSAQITLLTLSCQGSSMAQTLPSKINQAAMRLNMDTSMLPKRTLTLSMSMGRGYINGQDFDVSPYTIMSDIGTYEVWEIKNQSMMDHPFHQHVNAAQVLSISGGDSRYASFLTTAPAWKDVVIVPRMGSIKLLVPIMDYTGMTMFHCHIVEHEDIGMMGMWHIMGDGMPMP